MKRLSKKIRADKFGIFISLVIIHSTCVLARDFSVGINNDDPNPHAVLHISSPNGDQGLIIPLLTSSGRAAMTLAAEDKGLPVFDADQSLFCYRFGREWIPLSASDARQISPAGNSLSVSNGSEVAVTPPPPPRKSVNNPLKGHLQALQYTFSAFPAFFSEKKKTPSKGVYVAAKVPPKPVRFSGAMKAVYLTSKHSKLNL